MEACCSKSVRTLTIETCDYYIFIVACHVINNSDGWNVLLITLTCHNNKVMNCEKSPKEGSRKKRGKERYLYTLCAPSQRAPPAGSNGQTDLLPSSDRCLVLCYSITQSSCKCEIPVCVCVSTFFTGLIHLKLCKWQWDVRLDVYAFFMLQMLPLLMRSLLCVCVNAGWALRSSSRGLSSRATAGDSIPFWNGKRWVNPTHSGSETPYIVCGFTAPAIKPSQSLFSCNNLHSRVFSVFLVIY